MAAQYDVFVIADLFFGEYLSVLLEIKKSD